MLKQLLVTVIVAFLCYQALLIYEKLEFNRYVYNHKPGPCRLIKGIDTGSEDLEELPNGLVLITSGLVVGGMDKSAPAYRERKGSIKLFDFSHPEKAETVALEHDGGFDPKTFNPHGISSWHDLKSGEIFVFVINHLPAGKEVVERFRYDEKRRVLQHLETFPPTDDVYSLNDVVAVGARSFYYTNLQYFLNQPYATIEVLVSPSWAGVGYRDGESGATKIVQGGMVMANGISKSPDGKFIYVSHMGQKEVVVYSRQNDNSLTILQNFKVHTSADNLWVSPDGKSLWTGAQPIAWQTLKHLKDGKSLAPSQVLRLSLKDGLISGMQEVFADDGNLLISSSVAAYRDGKMIVGTVTHKALLCEVKYL